MSKEDYVSYELAKKLKECGFDEPCLYWYTNRFSDNVVTCVGPDESPTDHNKIGKNACSMPSLARAQKWLREKGIEVVVEPRFSNYKLIGYDWMCYDDCSGDYALRAPLPFSDSYESALSAGISSALQLIEGKGE